MGVRCLRARCGIQYGVDWLLNEHFRIHFEWLVLADLARRHLILKRPLSAALHYLQVYFISSRNGKA